MMKRYWVGETDGEVDGVSFTGVKMPALPGWKFVELKWTTETPTQDGWYWVNFHVGIVDFQVMVKYPLDGKEANMHLASHWLGPLPPPLPPTETPLQK